MGKRPKPPSQNGGSQVDSWQPGNVMRLQLKNFMCVNRVEYNFHPKLNWIIGMVSSFMVPKPVVLFRLCQFIPFKGANGTGKSTIVCALYLVFNGKPGNLGRGTSIAQDRFHTISP